MVVPAALGAWGAWEPREQALPVRAVAAAPVAVAAVAVAERLVLPSESTIAGLVVFPTMPGT